MKHVTQIGLSLLLMAVMAYSTVAQVYLSGQVTYNGSGIRGAVVTLNACDFYTNSINCGTTPAGYNTYTALTNSFGYFDFPNKLWVGQSFVTIKAHGYQTYVTTLPMEQDTFLQAVLTY